MKYVVVIGGANVDMIGTPFTSLSYKNSSPGSVKISHGGVGRNIAENLARMGVNVKLITVFGGDNYGKELKDHLTEVGVDISYSLTKNDTNTSLYLCLNDKNGEMQYALSAMEILKSMDEKFFEKRLEVINKAKLVVLDVNLLDTLKYLIPKITAPICVDTVSKEKVKLTKKYLNNLFFLKPNKEEAEELLDISINTTEDVEYAIDLLTKSGHKNVIITLGKLGSYYSNGKISGYCPAQEIDIVSTTGAGDSYFAGAVSALFDDMDIKECARRGSIASYITIMDNDNVSKKINKEIFS